MLFFFVMNLENGSFKCTLLFHCGQWVKVMICSLGVIFLQDGIWSYQCDLRAIEARLKIGEDVSQDHTGSRRREIVVKSFVISLKFGRFLDKIHRDMKVTAPPPPPPPPHTHTHTHTPPPNPTGSRLCVWSYDLLVIGYCNVPLNITVLILLLQLCWSLPCRDQRIHVTCISKDQSNEIQFYRDRLNKVKGILQMHIKIILLLVRIECKFTIHVTFSSYSWNNPCRQLNIALYCKISLVWHHITIFWQ